MTTTSRATAITPRVAPKLTSQEVLCSLPIGIDAGAASLPEYDGGSLSDSLEAVILPALQRSPCVVSFSGGRDSSAILAVAVDIARKHGLPEPVPTIMRLPNDPASDETDWQELVLRHLRIGQAEVLTVTSELDILGPMAADVLRRHGLTWPANAFAHRPVIDFAKGGSLLTGIGGDELLTPYVSLTRRHRLLLLAPFWLRRAWLSQMLRFGSFDWLTPKGRRLVKRGYARDKASEWMGWERTIRNWYRSRAFSGMATGLHLVADGHGVAVVNPFLHERVLVDLLHVGGPAGFQSRTDAMRRLFGHLLPDALLSRRTKATFGAEMWGETTRRFVSSWSGSGVDERLVHREGLLRELGKGEPDFRTALLLQQAWLCDQTSRNRTS